MFDIFFIYNEFKETVKNSQMTLFKQTLPETLNNQEYNDYQICFFYYEKIYRKLKKNNKDKKIFDVILSSIKEGKDLKIELQGQKKYNLHIQHPNNAQHPIYIIELLKQILYTIEISVPVNDMQFKTQMSLIHKNEHMDTINYSQLIDAMNSYGKNFTLTDEKDICIDNFNVSYNDLDTIEFGLLLSCFYIIVFFYSLHNKTNN